MLICERDTLVLSQTERMQLTRRESSIIEKLRLRKSEFMLGLLACAIRIEEDLHCLMGLSKQSTVKCLFTTSGACVASLIMHGNVCGTNMAHVRVWEGLMMRACLQCACRAARVSLLTFGTLLTLSRCRRPLEATAATARSVTLWQRRMDRPCIASLTVRSSGTSACALLVLWYYS